MKDDFHYSPVNLFVNGFVLLFWNLFEDVDYQWWNNACEVWRMKCKENLVWWLAVGGIMLLAGVLRFSSLSRAVLTNDEAYSWRISQYGASDVVSRTRGDANPPFYYLVLRTWEQWWGTSPSALRGLSSFLAVLCVPLSYTTSLCAFKLTRPPQLEASSWSRGSALFSAFLLAVHASQITPGRTARMYALGIFLAALTSCLLLKSLKERKHSLVWWAAYALAAVAFGLTHYYAFFALTAQGLFAVIFLVVQARVHGWRQIRVPAGGLVFALVLAGVLYAPWLPTLLGQIDDVRQGFWIPEVQPEQAARVFWPWSTGLKYLDFWEKTAWLMLLIFCVALTLCLRDAAGYFFLLQASVPWICGIALSVIWGRSIFYDRYLSFAQWALLCYFGTIFCRVPGWPLRVVLASFIGASALAGLDLKAPPGPSARAQAAAFLRGRALPGDEVWVSGPAEVNLTRYYCSQAGLADLRVRCRVPLGARGHLVHVASLSGEDVLDDEATEKLPRRFWKLSTGTVDSPPGARKVLEESFRDEVAHCNLALYQRSDK